MHGKQFADIKARHKIYTDRDYTLQEMAILSHQHAQRLRQRNVVVKIEYAEYLEEGIDGFRQRERIIDVVSFVPENGRTKPIRIADREDRINEDDEFCPVLIFINDVKTFAR